MFSINKNVKNNMNRLYTFIIVWFVDITLTYSNGHVCGESLLLQHDVTAYGIQTYGMGSLP